MQQRVMKDATRRQARPAGGGAAVFASVTALLVFTFMPLLVFAATPPGRGAVQESPRFASLEIDIWPEFDRRAALVILKGELAADVALPAAVSVRIPASSGGPSAVAFASAAKTELFNLVHDRIDGDEFITLRFQAPQRLLHIEFYDPLMTGTPDRAYTYIWPGDLAVERLSVRLQEPAAAGSISVQPDLGTGVGGPGGLLYRTAALGAFEAGKQLPVEIRYTKTDSRTSTEILGLKAADPAPPALADSSEGLPAWVLGLISVAIVSIGAVAASLWWWRRRGTVPGAQSTGAGYCSRCGRGLALGDRFCPACGASSKGADRR